MANIAFASAESQFQVLMGSVICVLGSFPAPWKRPRAARVCRSIWAAAAETTNNKY